MLRFRKIFLMLLLAALTTAARPSHAALIRTCDLDSLCYWSTDVVEATFVRQPLPGQKERQGPLKAMVVSSLIGTYHPGDRISSLDVDLYRPLAVGQRCILFLAHKQLVDMLLIDSHNHVRRYFQWMNPGGLLAEGFSLPNNNQVTEDDSAEQSFPTLAEERSTITSKWAAIDRLRPLLSHDPQMADVPILLNLLRERRPQHTRRGIFHQELEDGIARTICSRLADLHNPSVALDAMALVLDSNASFLSGLEDAPFQTDQSIAYARAVLASPREMTDRRIAAAEVLQKAANRVGKQTKLADRATVTTVALADATPESLRLFLIPNLNLTQGATVNALRQFYHKSQSQEVQFAIEKAFDNAADGHGDALYFSLKPASGPILSIVRPSGSLPIKPGYIGLSSEFSRTSQIQGPEIALTQTYVFTNIATGKVFRVSLGGEDISAAVYEEEQVPLPKSLAKGQYKIALEFREKGRLMSRGHSATMTLP